MSALSRHTCYASVRSAFAEEAVYREALGRAEPLRVAVIDGPLDAPEWIPAGGTKGANSHGAVAQLMLSRTHDIS
jgi:hypothetical protein